MNSPVDNPNHLSKALRVVGVGALGLSGAVFLIQGLQGLDHFFRFLAFSGLVGALALLGVFCAEKLQEPKGARTLLALATAGVSVIMSQLGAMIYDRAFSGEQQFVPGVFRAAEVSGPELAWAAGATLLVALLGAGLGFAVLDREKKLEYAGLFLALNGILLLPNRSPVVVYVALVALGLGLVHLRIRAQALQAWRITPERGIALGFLFLPAVIATARAGFYGASALWFAGVLLLGALAAATAEVVGETREPGLFSLPLASLGVSLLLLDQLHPLLSAAPCMATVLVVLHLMVRAAESLGYHRNSTFLRMLWPLGSVVMIVAILDDGGYRGAMVGLALGAFALCEGYTRRSRATFLSGGTLAVLGLVLSLRLALRDVNLFHWANLAGAGVVVLLAASMIERYQPQVRERLTRLRNHLQ